MTRVERTEFEIKENITLLQMHLRLAYDNYNSYLVYLHRGNPQKYNNVREKLSKILQDVSFINAQFQKLGEKGTSY